LQLLIFQQKTSEVSVFYEPKEVFFEKDEIMITKTEDEKLEVKPKQIDIQELVIVEDDQDDGGDIFIDTEVDGDDIINYQTIIDFAEPIVEDEDEPIQLPSKWPVFPGGEKGLMKYIFDKVVYPPLAREQQIEGKVYIRFCVTKYGTVDRVSVVRSADPILDKEAMRVVKLLPKWEPGENGGRKVSVWYTVPINFQLK
jgi:protein TonB